MSSQEDVVFQEFVQLLTGEVGFDVLPWRGLSLDAAAVPAKGWGR